MKIKHKAIELTVLMPCLNEAETLAICIRKAQDFLNANDVVGEVLIADNGSNDGSQKIASDLGARVIDVSDKGYGNALISGIKNAWGTYVIMGDADDSYNFSGLALFLESLRQGNDLVMGNRFKGGGGGRGRKRCHAAAAPIFRKSGFEFYWSIIFPFQYWGFSLRAQGVQPGANRGIKPGLRWYGICQ